MLIAAASPGALLTQESCRDGNTQNVPAGQRWSMNCCGGRAVPGPSIVPAAPLQWLSQGLGWEGTSSCSIAPLRDAGHAQKSKSGASRGPVCCGAGRHRRAAPRALNFLVTDEELNLESWVLLRWGCVPCPFASG